ncbi:lysine/arginine/ornithine ABC transporter substrate-binding protein [Rodentibacter heidelbergensis]|uniref:Arginine ABC transporter substrate-binding protein n=1 Tax=Rodentibacter heidelbergensis TaxID=1908258 RepID=A0A1V3I9H3_9PAST|nr:lysine/arginine/ornithine ABC transporter substrate-binding protein [Rodentibacter heidelbergensis]OOF36677.1 arginine ABC transporter substrate-binding protein [Rodentibacter heidelbergensis]
MKKPFLLGIFIAAVSATGNAEELTFGTEPNYPPFEVTTEKGELIGFDIDIAQAICKEIQATCHFKTQPFDALIPSLKAKRFDAAMSAIDITPSREKQILFTDPYYDSSASYVALKGKGNLATAKNIGVQNGSTFQQYTVAETPQYSPKSYVNLQDAILDLQNGRIDIVLSDTALLADMMTKEPNIEFIGEKVTNEKYFGRGVGIALNKSNKALQERLNQGLKAIKEKGEYQKIYDKWMKK